ncbi:sigma-70 family RNA polymerase sigma factor [Microbispora sp. NBRC 16548]|uniref:sigma-70 family RNA polymerase sigma factor n=1 Tax=Microbispora sp. NBRC 16548 TaxID=3030994 RepID=UPI001619BCA9|nr:sigma-70 family RNA polymerase sigma factor [Microbispora sp. NBRC 16548]GLX06691.1 hypothetical protein Misp03_36180 [Microbispora sp. NBRC 16548]
MIATAMQHAASEQDLDADATVGDSVQLYLKEIGRVPLLTPREEVELAQQIEAGLFAQEQLDQLDPSSLTIPDTLYAELQALSRLGEQAKQRMIEANLRLVVSIARRYTGRGMELPDLISDGNFGLIRAVQKFDYVQGFKFSTYATWWIRQSIQRALAERSRTVRLPNHVHEELSRIRRVERSLEQTLNRDPTVTELANALDMTVKQTTYLLNVRQQQPISLDAPLDETGRVRVGDLIEDLDAPQPPEVVIDTQRREAMQRALNVLSEREAEVITRRFGLVDGHPRTLDDIGQEFGLTRERIRQIEKAALAKLRDPAVQENLRAWLS